MRAMRVFLGTITLVLVGISFTGRYYRTVVVCLILIASLAADDCRSAGKMITSEAFAASGPTETAAPATAAAATAAVTKLPWGVYDALAPSMEKMASVVRGDAGSVEQTSTDLTPALYAGQQDLLGTDGTLDKTKFESMKLQYKRIVTFLCRMKNLAPDAHDTMVKAIGGCASS